MKMPPAILRLIALITGGGDPGLEDPKILNEIVENALPIEKLEKRGSEGEELRYAPNSQTPYTGWSKGLWDNGQIKWLTPWKDGKEDGFYNAVKVEDDTSAKMPDTEKTARPTPMLRVPNRSADSRSFVSGGSLISGTVDFRTFLFRIFKPASYGGMMLWSLIFRPMTSSSLIAYTVHTKSLPASK
jgi:hypothetical protein